MLTINGYHGFSGGGQFRVSSGTTTFTGAGVIRMNAFGAASTIFNAVENTVGVLENYTSIVGGGMIGVSGGYIGGPADAYLVLHNHGTVNADSGTDSIVISPGTASPSTTTNDKLFEATGTAGLQFLNTNIDQTSTGVIGAYGPGSHVDFSGVTLRGGAIDGSYGGFVQNTSSFALDGRSEANGGLGAIVIMAGGVLRTGSTSIFAKGTITNHGEIEVSPGGANLRVTAEGLTLNGGGQVALETSNNYFGAITGDGGSTILHNVDNTISGAGSIGGAPNDASNPSNVMLDNQANGSVVANLSGFTLTLQSITVANAGLLEATNGGILSLTNYSGPTTVTQTALGAILADGATSTVDLGSGNTIIGGKLVALNGGTIQAGNNTVLDGSTSAGNLVIAGALDVKYATILKGLIYNNGTIVDASSVIMNNVTLSGGGTLTMRDGGTSVNDGGGTLVNIDNQLTGSGRFNTNLKIDNRVGGVINATSATEQMVLYQGQILSNAGLIEATGAAGLHIQGMTIDDRAGGHLFVGDGSVIDLDAATVLGGSLQGAGSGYYDLKSENGNTSFLANVNIAATVKLGGGRNLYVSGDIFNTGTIVIDSALNNANAPATLYAAGAWTGGGHISLTNAPASTLNMNGTWSSDNIISGAGMFSGTGGAGVAFTNTGTVDAIYAANALTIATGQTLTNNGTFKADSGKLIVNDAVTGSGTAIVTNGGTLDFTANFQENVSFQGSNAGTLLLSQAYGGVISGFGKGDTIDFAGFSYATGDHVVLQSSVGGIETFGVETSGNAVVTMFHVSGSQPASAFEVQTNANHDLLLSYGGHNLADSADFNGDGRSDILWSNANGDTAIWTATGSGGFTNADLGLIPTSWQVVGTGDFKGTGNADLVWRNSNGDTNIWYANGSGGFTSSDLGIIPTNWQLSGTGDFSGDGLADVLWRNSNGDTNVWYSNGSGGFSSTDLGIVPTNWQIAGSGDFTGTGTDDIIWRNTANGDTNIWEPTGSGGFTSVDLGIVPTSWQIAGTGDFTGTGTDDILWRNTTNGDTAVWTPTGSGGFTSADLGIVSTSWQIAGLGDFNGNGTSDILWHNTTNGDTNIWSSNGSGGFTGADLGIVPTSWSVKAA